MLFGLSYHNNLLFFKDFSNEKKKMGPNFSVLKFLLMIEI